MKKYSGILLVLVLALSMLAISCEQPQVKEDQRVLVSLGAGTGSSSRGLDQSVTLEQINDESLKWYYKAEKADELPFKHGETDGFTEFKLGSAIEFSQGRWNFSIQAEKDDIVVYYGSISNVLITKGTSPVSVSIPVSPIVSGVNGNVVLDDSVYIYIKKASDSSDLTTKPTHVKIDDGPIMAIGEKEWSLEAGVHEFVFLYQGGSDNLVIASEAIFVTVYSGRTTTITGFIEEETGSAIIKPSVDSVTVSESVKEDGSLSFTAESATPAMEGNSTEVSFPARTFSSNKEASLEVEVTPIDGNFNIDNELSPVASLKLSLNVEGNDITDFGGKAAAITTYIAKGLSGVEVKYNGEGAAPENVVYESNTGKLTFTTTHFSEFYVRAHVAIINGISDNGYYSLADAIDAASSGDTITMLRNSSGKGIGSADNGEFRDNLTIDFAGFSYTMNDPAVGSTGTESQAMHWGKTLGSVVMKNGTFKIAEHAEEVKMAMQNYIKFEAESMTFDFSNIPVTRYGIFDEPYEEYSNLEVPMFNCNGTATALMKNCTVIMPSDSKVGITGDSVTLEDSTIEGYVNLQTEGLVFITKGNTTFDGVVSYFEDGIIESHENDGVTTYELIFPGAWYTDNPEANEFTISNVSELVYFRNLVNGKISGKEAVSFEGKTVKLEKGTYDLSAIDNWEPIGTGDRKLVSATPFRGKFDGQGSTIIGLDIAIRTGIIDDDMAVGFFGIVAGQDSSNRASISNLIFENAIVSSDTNTSGIAIGYAENADIAGIVVRSSSISGFQGVGAIVGRLYGAGSIVNCLNDSSSVKATSAGFSSVQLEEIRNSDGFAVGNVGGIAGCLSGENVQAIENTVNLKKGGIISSDESFVAFIVGTYNGQCGKDDLKNNEIIIDSLEQLEINNINNADWLWYGYVTAFSNNWDSLGNSINYESNNSVITTDHPSFRIIEFNSWLGETLSHQVNMEIIEDYQFFRDGVSYYGTYYTACGCIDCYFPEKVAEDGTGTQEDPFIISSAYHNTDFAWMNDENVYFKLAEDIELTENSSLTFGYTAKYKNVFVDLNGFDIVRDGELKINADGGDESSYPVIIRNGVHASIYNNSSEASEIKCKDYSGAIYIGYSTDEEASLNLKGKIHISAISNNGGTIWIDYGKLTVDTGDVQVSGSDQCSIVCQDGATAVLSGGKYYGNIRLGKENGATTCRLIVNDGDLETVTIELGKWSEAIINGSNWNVVNFKHIASSDQGEITDNRNSQF